MPVHSRVQCDQSTLPAPTLPPWPNPWLGWRHSSWQTEWERFAAGDGALPHSPVAAGIELETALRREDERGHSQAAESLGLWLAFHGRPEDAIEIVKDQRQPGARRLAGLIAWRALLDPARAVPFLEAGPLHDPVAVAEVDELFAELGATEKRIALLDRAPNHRLIVERRADLALAQGRPEETLRLLNSTSGLGNINATSAPRSGKRPESHLVWTRSRLLRRWERTTWLRSGRIGPIGDQCRTRAPTEVLLPKTRACSTRGCGRGCERRRRICVGC